MRVEQRVTDIADGAVRFRKELQKDIVGLSTVIDTLYMCLIAGGHVLLEGVPGLGKTRVVTDFGAATDGKAGIIAGTPDTLPEHLIGSYVWNQKIQDMELRFGAIKPEYNLLILDEINRLQPKTQSAFLSLMQDLTLIIEGNVIPVANPFIAMATENPIEQEGTYPLVEAALDRFAVKIVVGYVSDDEEIELVERPSAYASAQDAARVAGIEQVMSMADVIEMRKCVHDIRIERAVTRYIINLVRSTRPNCWQFKYLNPKHAQLIQFGASQRAGLWLTVLAKAHAAVAGRTMSIIEDVQSIAEDVLAHRLTLHPGVKMTEDPGIEREVIRDLIQRVPTVIS